MREYCIAALPGDGIGPEVVREAVRAANAAAARFGFSLKWQTFPYGAEYYLAHGVALPPQAMGELDHHDAMLLGAVGDPRVKPGPLEQGLLLALRFHFDQFVNLRPAQSWPGVRLPVPLPQGAAIDAMVVRENTEDLYMGIGGRGTGSLDTAIEARRGLYRFSGRLTGDFTPDCEAAFSLAIMSRPGVERIARHAFALAKARGETLVHVVGKANAVPHLYGFWDEVVAEVAAKEFPGMRMIPLNVDAACYRMVRNPAEWGVVLCPNLFGDILSDLLSGLTGGLGLAAAGNIGPRLSMFEPVHGSAPDIAGTGKANPLAAILSAAMLLDHLGEKEAGGAVRAAVGYYLASGSSRPIELGGAAGTVEVGDAVTQAIAGK